MTTNSDKKPTTGGTAAFWGGLCGAIFLASLSALAVIYIPIWTIWALNALFHTGIVVNFWTWLSSLWLIAILAARRPR